MQIDKAVATIATSTQKKTFNVGKEMARYKDAMVHIQILMGKKRELEIEVEDCMPNCIQTMSDMPRGNTTSDSTANTAIKIEELMTEIRKTERNIEKEKRTIETVNLLIETLKEEDQDLINKRVKQKKKWEVMQVELYEKYTNYTHYKSVERRYNEIIIQLQRKMDNM